ncbi:MAG: hypothetical protein M1816_004215 [Peltula sp. TS41687]|nr:MAG: hypothetical protein M1816_004215 [Peltula sp. TS41687]
MCLQRRLVHDKALDRARAPCTASVHENMASLRMASTKLGAWLGMPGQHPVPDPPFPISADALTIAESRRQIIGPANWKAIQRQKEGIMEPKPIVHDEDMDSEEEYTSEEDEDECEIIRNVKEKIGPLPPRSPGPPILNGMQLCQRLYSYLGTHSIDFRNITELWVQGHHLRIGADGVGYLDERPTGVQWIWFTIQEKRQNGGWVSFGCPADTVSVETDMMLEMIKPDGNKKPLKCVELRPGLGGLPIFDGAKFNVEKWEHVSQMMSMGTCRITYLFDPYVDHVDPVYGTIRP